MGDEGPRTGWSELTNWGQVSDTEEKQARDRWRKTVTRTRGCRYESVPSCLRLDTFPALAIRHRWQKDETNCFLPSAPRSSGDSWTDSLYECFNFYLITFIGVLVVSDAVTYSVSCLQVPICVFSSFPLGSFLFSLVHGGCSCFVFTFFGGGSVCSWWWWYAVYFLIHKVLPSTITDKKMMRQLSRCLLVVGHRWNNYYLLSVLFAVIGPLSEVWVIWRTHKELSGYVHQSSLPQLGLFIRSCWQSGVGICLPLPINPCVLELFPHYILTSNKPQPKVWSRNKTHSFQGYFGIFFPLHLTWVKPTEKSLCYWAKQLNLSWC